MEAYRIGKGRKGQQGCPAEIASSSGAGLGARPRRCDVPTADDAAHSGEVQLS